MKKRVIVSVINDLATDQRVKKVCQTLHEMGFEVTLIGRILPGSLAVSDRPYRCIRMKLWFTTGALFYAEFNIRLFLHLLFTNVDIVHSNDLDTLLANFLVSKIKSKPLIYDAHEYFTEVPELEHRPTVKKVWQGIEGWIFPKLKFIITVNDSIANLYEKRYGKRPQVLRNVPELVNIPTSKTREELGLPEDKAIIVLQGSGINIQRGAEEALEAMQFVDNAVLVFIGGGDVLSVLKQRANQSNFSGKVIFFPKIPYTEMMQITRLASIGLTLDKDTNINYRYSLPNKIFDYIHAGVPVLASDLPEVRKIVEGYDVGLISPNHNPKK